MTTDEKINLITRNLAEVLTESELRELIDSGTPLKHYIGFEISGKLHIGHFYQLLKVKDLQDAGATTTIWLADLHSAINDKLDGNLDTIGRLAEDYFVPAMKVLFEAIGGDPEKLRFELCSQTYSEHPEMWQTVLEMGKATSLSRTMRSITIMGREQSDDSIETAKLMYPIMQAADIFLLEANIAQAGMDQRKVHVVARDGAMQIKTNPLMNARGAQIKPIAIHTPILLGLTPPEAINQDDTADEIAMKTKMSKSKADSSVSVHDSAEDIKSKINKAYAPIGVVEQNPVINWAERLIFYNEGSLIVERSEENGGNISYNNFADLKADYEQSKLHPMDLKAAVTKWLIETLEPVRKAFEDPKRKAALEEIQELSTKKS